MNKLAVKSLSLRLTLIFLVVALGVWLVAGFLSWRESRETLDEFFDSYQLLLAHQLAQANWRGFSGSGGVSPFERLDQEGSDEGEADDKALAFAVFSDQGQLIFSDGEKGGHLPFQDTVGFGDIRLESGQPWRLVYIRSQDGAVTVAVGQPLKYRREAAWTLAGQVLTPWLLGLLILAATTLVMVKWELRPLKNLAGGLASRKPGDLTQVETSRLPPEVAPLGVALNGMFGQMAGYLAGERAFVADAAHELRTPLAALRVQAEVAELSGDDPAALTRALGHLIGGIDRTTRLVNQLLTLSRLDSGQPETPTGVLNWPELIDRATRETGGQKALTVERFHEGEFGLKVGHPGLIDILLRNLLDNAHKYSPEKATITIRLTASQLVITNSGAGVEANSLKRLGERFFRPPGQAQVGSGLGLSIVKRIAEMHNCTLKLENYPPDSFSVRLII